MTAEELDVYLRRGEDISVEFKHCGNRPENDTFETVCSFANRQGGNLFLGVADNGVVTGVDAASVRDIQRNVVNVISNPKLFNVAPVVEFETIDYDGQVVLRIWVPQGPAVYRFRGTVFDRLADVDVRIVGVDQLALMYLRKQNLYSEGRVYPYVTGDDIRRDLVERARNMATARTPQHPWRELDDEALLRSAKLIVRDRQTGEEGYTLAAVVLVGTDDLIGDVLPAYKTDAILRRDDVDRYDDRMTVRTNLLDAYDLLCDFAARHVPDRFALDGDRRVSARDIMVRELVVNLLIHREFSSPFPAKLVIDGDAMRTENASRTLYEGRLTLSDFNPISKNPRIAEFFSQVGLAEELGSGLRNLHRYSMVYSGREPTLEDGDVFRAIVPLTPLANAADRVDAAIDMLLGRDGRVTSAALARAAGVTPRTAQRHIRAALDDGRLARSGRAYVDGGAVGVEPSNVMSGSRK